MWKTLASLGIAVTVAAGCAHNGEMPTVRAGNDPDPSNPRVRDAGRIAGGSHATGAETFSGAGSTR
jgi:hypothetical protein